MHMKYEAELLDSWAYVVCSYLNFILSLLLNVSVGSLVYLVF